MQSFNDVVELFKTRGFAIQEFVDDLMCVLSREKEGLNEAVKIKQNLVQIQAWKSTITELCSDLSKYCKDIV